MTKIYEMDRPTLAFSGLEMIPAMQFGSDVAIPLFAARELPRGNVLIMREKYIAERGSTTDSDPGTGKLRWNNVTPDDADTLFISDDDTEANTGMASALQSGVLPGGRIYIQGCADLAAREVWQIWEVVDPGTDGTGYTQQTVLLVDSRGVFADDDPIEVSVVNPEPEPDAVPVRTGIVPMLPSSGGVMVISYLYGSDNFLGTLNENLDSITFEDLPAGDTNGTKLHFEYLFVQDTTPWTITWPASFNWCGESPPSMPTSPGDRLYVVTDSFDGGTTWIARAYLLD